MRLLKRSCKLLCIVILFCSFVLYNFSFTDCFCINAVAEEYHIGDIIEYGNYPQTDVTNELGEVLNEQNGTWISYKYYSGTGVFDDGQMAQSDYMKFKDVIYKGNKYRGVLFESYRPYCTGLTQADNNQNQFGYLTDITYWFKYDSLKWRVLDPSSGLIMCDSIIDCQAYNNYIISNRNAYWGDPAQTYYANDYASSSIRYWLNNDFFNTAFWDSQKTNIKTTMLNNNCYLTLIGHSGFEKYDSKNTQDKVFLLSYNEVLNSSYGFNVAWDNYDSNRQKKPTDYAKCQGSGGIKDNRNAYNGYSTWMLRTPSEDTLHSALVSYDGVVYNSTAFVMEGLDGICPAMQLEVIKNDIAGLCSEIPYNEVITNSNSNSITSTSNIIIYALVAVIIILLFIIILILKKKEKEK